MDVCYMRSGELVSPRVITGSIHLELATCDFKELPDETEHTFFSQMYRNRNKSTVWQVLQMQNTVHACNKKIQDLS